LPFFLLCTRKRPLLRRSLADAVFDAGPAGLMVSTAGRVGRANRAAVALLGEAPAGAAVEGLFPADQQGAVAGLLRAVLSGMPAEPVDLLLAAGPTRVQASRLSEADGTVAGAWLTLMDIGREAGLARQLAEAQRLQALGQLAGGIAHDFNNLLTAIRLAAEAISERAAGETREDAGQIQQAAARGAELVQRLLAFGRQQALQPGPLVANEAVQGVAGLLARLMGETVRVQLALETPARLVHVDRVQLDQVLVNLAVNARDAMPGGGSLHLATGHATVLHPEPGFPDTLPPGRYVTIEVADSGSGIAPDVLPRIFEPFFTTRSAQAGTTGGAGLGLATVHGILRQSGGFLSVETVVGQGTRMRIHLPRWDGPAPAPPPPPAAAARVDGQCLLLVEDEDSVRVLAERALTRRGWRVLAAASGEEALELLEDSGAAPDVIVSDMVMPGMDGAALVAAVRARLGRPALPALLVSGYAAESLRAAMAAAGAGFLAKPYRLADLADRLAASVGGR
jgi:two-component system cell cycle sensor histidine kinase/response regulator CckA